jgi:carbonic anhydrase
MEFSMSMPHDLHEGYQRFRGDRLKVEADRYRSLAAEQNPATMIIGCADSRVDPAYNLAKTRVERTIVQLRLVLVG